MRIWILKFFAFLAWSLFLFMPILARADGGMETWLPVQAQGVKTPQYSVGGVTLQFDRKSVRIPAGGKWALQFNAGRDTAADSALPATVQRGRLQFDNGQRKSFMFGVGLSYRF